MATTHDELSDLNDSIHKIIHTEQFIKQFIPLEKLLQKMEDLPLAISNRLLTIGVSCKFKKKIDFHLKCKEAKEIIETFQTSLDIHHFGFKSSLIKVEKQESVSSGRAPNLNGLHSHL